MGSMSFVTKLQLQLLKDNDLMSQDYKDTLHRAIGHC